MPVASRLSPTADPTANPTANLDSMSAPSRLRRAAPELVGGAVALLLGLAMVAHLVLTARSEVFFYNGDSVLMPLVEKSFRAGQPFEWAMSSVLFLVPEIPVYAAISLFAPDPHVALIVNALVIVVALYALVRLCVAAVASSLGRAARIAIALAPVAALAVLSLFEHSDQRESFELVSLLVTTTYYYGTALALVAVAALTIIAHNRPAGRRSAPLLALAAVCCLATFSNPLFAVWATGPALLTLLVVHRARLRAVYRLRAPLLVATAVVVGTAIGWIARIPMQPFISISLGHYFRAYRIAGSFSHYLDQSWRTASTWQGGLEMSALAVGVFGTLAVAVVAAVRRWPTPIRIGLVLPASSIVVTGVVAVVLGTTATRYLLPLFIAPAIATAVLLVHLAQRLPGRTGLASARMRLPRRATALLVSGALLIAAGSVEAIRAAPSTRLPTANQCVADWVGGRDLTGAGRFWTIRAFQAYGPASIKLLQVGPKFGASLWLDNAADFRSQSVSYVVTDSHSTWSKGAIAALGTPARVVSCAPYTILDFQHTKGEDLLSDRIGETAQRAKAARGFRS